MIGAHDVGSLIIVIDIDSDRVASIAAEVDDARGHLPPRVFRHTLELDGHRYDVLAHALRHSLDLPDKYDVHVLRGADRVLNIYRAARPPVDVQRSGGVFRRREGAARVADL